MFNSIIHWKLTYDIKKKKLTPESIMSVVAVAVKKKKTINRQKPSEILKLLKELQGRMYKGTTPNSSF